MSLLVTATLACALTAVLGGILLVRKRDESASAASAQSSAFPEGGATPTTPLGRLKAVIQAGDWATALPALLALGGILGVMLFGALALIFALDQSRGGWPMLILAILTIGWAAREFVRA